MGLVRLFYQMVMSIRVYLKMDCKMELDCASLSFQDKFIEENGGMVNLKVLARFLHFQMKWLKRDLMGLILLMDK